MEVSRLTDDAVLPLELKVVITTEEALADLYARMYWEPDRPAPDCPGEPEFTETDELYETLKDFITEYSQELH